CDHSENSEAGVEEGPVSAQSELCTGDVREPAADLHHVPDALSDLHPAHHRRAVLFAFHLLVLYLRTAAGAWKRGECVPGDGGFAAEFRDHSGPPARAETRASGGGRPTGDARL